RERRDNCDMEIAGHVENGVVVLDDGAVLPEGAKVIVSELSTPDNGHSAEKKSAELPLVPGGQPGSVHLTNERIYQILHEDDLAAMTRTWDVPT
ncbi:MAG: hypothetical protein WAN69_07235, partial [Candidatus Korobacteraceae bacterium]